MLARGLLPRRAPEERPSMRPASRRRSAGFTAIEIMIVVAIIGIFAALAIPSWRAYQANLQLKAAARTVATAAVCARRRLATSATIGSTCNACRPTK